VSFSVHTVIGIGGGAFYVRCCQQSIFFGL